MEEKKFTIYLHRCPNGKCYVGMTSQTPKSRWGKQGNKYKNNKDFYSDIEKYGWDNIEHIILEDKLNIEDACESEKYNIKKYSCIFPSGYNIAIGGDIPNRLGIKMKEDTKEKLRIANTGKKRSQETIEKIRISSIGRHHSKETKEKISNANIGREFSNKHKTKLSENHCSVKYGKNPNSTKVKKYSLTGELISIHESMSELVDIYGKNIYACCNGMVRSYYGFVFRYINDDFNKYKTDREEIKSIIDGFVFNSLSDIDRYLKVSMGYTSKILKNKTPQKYIDRGLRYYNPETDKDLPIYIDTKDEV